MKITFRYLTIITGFFLLIQNTVTLQAQQVPAAKGSSWENLIQGFITPPDSAKPRTWWHWTASNITKEGITKDLEWMKRSGIGGFMMFDVSFGMGQTVPNKLIVFTPEWLDALKHATSEAGRLGLEMTLHTSAGWSETGGPWVKPEEAVKKLSWNETEVTGPQKYSGILPVPSDVTGPFRDMVRQAGILGGSGKKDPNLYTDSRIIAYRTPDNETDIRLLDPKITASGENVNGALLIDNSLATKISLPKPVPGKPAWVQFEFSKPFTAQAFSVALALSGSYGSSNMRPGSVKLSDDGTNWQTIASMPGAQHDIRALPVRTYSFAPTTGRFFRIEFSEGAGITTVGGPDGGGFGGAPAGRTFDIPELKLYSGGRVNRWEDKANFAPMFEFETLNTPDVSSGSSINKSEIIDITSKMNPDGKLTWDVPAGKWTIMRIGWSLTGAKNSPAVPAGTGFEVDKLSRKHLESYYFNYTNIIKGAIGPMYGKVLKYWLVDSYEADAQNWTDNMISEFKTRRGYDPVPFMPVLTGRIVENSGVSDRFLWDFRRTIADLLAEDHYGFITELAHRDGIKTYSEAAGISLPIIEDALLNKGKMDIPMAEFTMTQGLGDGAQAWMSPADLDNDHSWRGAGDRMNAHQADVREAASTSHIYGKTLVGAESWTGGGYEAPYSMKGIGDYWNSQGINRFIFHTSAHQPLDTKPGNCMVGTHLNRNITWADLALPYFTYLARNSFLLQQGKFVADIAYYLGDGIPAAVPYWEKIRPEPPAGYDYDFINTEILLQSATVEDGMIILKSGMKYRLLVLPETDKMSLSILKKIQELVSAGATVIGPKPVKSPGLSGYPEADKLVALLANEMWGDADGRMIYSHAYGKGKIYWGVPLTGPLVDMKVKRDFDFTRPHLDTYLTWLHRRAGETDIYFVSNQRNQSEKVDITIRTDGKIPELWHPDSGVREKVTYSINNGMTTVSVNFDPKEALFIVLHDKDENRQWVKNESVSSLLTELSGPWDIAFQPNLGAPATIKMEKLESWSENSEAGVKYFSGTASYSRNFEVPKQWITPGTKIILDLGEVKDIAEISVNGKSLNVLWKPPYKVDITGAVRKGANKIEVKVTNQWNNRIAGDRSMPEGKKILSGSGFSFGNQGGGKLEKSGLLGPVKILAVTERKNEVK